MVMGCVVGCGLLCGYVFIFLDLLCAGVLCFWCVCLQLSLGSSQAFRLL